MSAVMRTVRAVTLTVFLTAVAVIGMLGGRFRFCTLFVFAACIVRLFRTILARRTVLLS